MKTLRFETLIHAPPETVWRTMLDQETYGIWTAEFTVRRPPAVAGIPACSPGR